MPTTTIIRGGYDTWVASGSPTSRHPIDTRLRLQGATSYGYVYFPLGPELRNVTILSATLYQYGRDTGWGVQTLTAQSIAAAWDAGTLTWNNRPGVGATTATRAQGNPADLTEWPLDVTALVQEFASGSRWRGMRLSIGDTVLRRFNSLNADRGKPRLEVTWTQAPATPVDLSPAGGRAVSSSRPTLAWANDNSPETSSFTDFNVQIDPAANGTTPAFASGTVASTLAEYDLAQSAYVGLAAAATTQWRVRVRAGGLWSPWSDWASFTRVDKGTVSITTPVSTVAEYTPPVAWTTSGTQVAWRLLVFDDSIDSSEPRYDTGRKTGTTQDHTLPGRDPKTDRRVLVDGRSYRLVVRAWDAVDREATPGDPPFASAAAIFNFADDPTPNQVTSFVAAQVGITPYVDLTWQRTTTPDSWTILDNTKVVAENIPGADLLVSGTSYSYRYRDARPGAHDFKVKPTVNGLTAISPSASVTLTPSGVWVIGKDVDDADVDVFIAAGKELGDFSMPDRGTTFDLPGSRAPVRVTQGVGGWRGTVSGRLVNAAGKTTEEWRDRMLKLKRRGLPVTLFVGGEVIRAVIFDVNVDPSRDGGQTRAVSFEFFQVGTIDWLD